MDNTAKKVLEGALKLPPGARAALAGALLDSLDEVVDPDREDAWDREIAKRVSEIDSGRAALLPWSEARRRIAGE